MCKDVIGMKDVIISITGVQNFTQGSDDTVELVTEGKYSYRDGRGELSYMESELTGMQGTRTSFTFGPDEVVLSREGTLTSKMVFREGTKNTFLYDTPFGSATMAITSPSALVSISFGAWSSRISAPSAMAASISSSRAVMSALRRR